MIQKIFSTLLAILMMLYSGVTGYEPKDGESFSLIPDDIRITTVDIESGQRKISAVIVSPKGSVKNATGVLWIHGGGYVTGMKEMIFMSRALELVRAYGAVVIAPDYTLSVKAPYPAAAEDCYSTLAYLKEHCTELGVRDDQLMVGGESAGGGLCAAVCMMARDRKEVNVAFQMPLYPMLDNLDTESSRDNHGKVWNTTWNHLAWKLYLREDAKSEVSPYAAPARQTDYTNLPPAYTFVGDGEPFYCETLEYIDNLKKAGVPAEVDVYHSEFHSFDMLTPWKDISKDAKHKFNEHFVYAQQHYFAEQN